MRLVLDTGVLMLVLIGDPGVRRVVELVRSGAEAYTAATNLAELRYKVEEKLGKAVAVTWANRLLRTPELQVVPVDVDLAMKAGELKAKYRTLISLADAIALALALDLSARLITTDEALKSVEEVEVQVIRPK